MSEHLCGKLQCCSNLSLQPVTLSPLPVRFRNQALDNTEEVHPAGGAGGDHTAVCLYRESLTCTAALRYLRWAAVTLTHLLHVFIQIPFHYRFITRY